MNSLSKIYVAGHRGMVGSAIIRELHNRQYTNIVTRTHAELDLTRQADVEAFLIMKSPIMSFLLLPKSEEYWLMIPTKQILFMKIS